MKKTLLFISVLLLSYSGHAQGGSIQGFTVDPASPSSSDFVRVYVDLMFPYSNCDLDTQTHLTSGTVTDASAHHCMGMLAAICNATDTFDLGFLPPGAHKFRFSLSTTSGGPPCPTPILVDDTDSVLFSVSTATAIAEATAKNTRISLYPNPLKSVSTLKINSTVKLRNAEIIVINVLGKTVRTIPNIRSSEVILERQELQNGIYFYQLRENGKTIATGKFVVE